MRFTIVIATVGAALLAALAIAVTTHAGKTTVGGGTKPVVAMVSF